MFDDLIEKQKENSEKTKTPAPAKLAINPFESKSDVVFDGQNPKEEGGQKTLSDYNQKEEEQDKAKEKFEDKISELRQKGERRGKRYSAIGIIGSLVIFIIVVYFGYKIIGQVGSLTKTVDEQQNNDIIGNYFDPENKCQGNNCCLASMEKINRNNYQEIDESQDCDDGFFKTSLNCEGSLYWCQIDVLKEGSGQDVVEDYEDQTKKEEDVLVSTSTMNEVSTEQGDEVFERPTSSTETIQTFEDEELIDTDSDGLLDHEELQYGTDINNPDSDGDGYFDGEEVRQGYNPVGSGSL